MARRMLRGVLAMKHLNGWNRLFVVVAVCWAVVAPFVIAETSNAPTQRIHGMCADSAYRNYGASDSPIRLDFDKYHAETAKCLQAFERDFVSLQKLFHAMTGTGDRLLGLVTWGFIVIPLCLLWVLGWAFGRTAKWVAAGFRNERKA